MVTITKEAFIRGMSARLNEVNLEIDALIARENQIGAAGYAEYTRCINAMRQYCGALRTILEKFRGCRNDEDAETLKSSLKIVWEILAQTLISARERFR